MRTSLLAGIALVLAVLASAGCGGDGSAEQPTLSAAQWRARADAVCRTIGLEVRAVPEPKTTEEIESFTAAVIPLWDRERRQIRALTAPAELAPRARDLLTALDYLSVGLVEVHVAAQRFDGARRQDAVQRVEDAARGIRLRSSALGLDACSAQRIP